MRVFRRIYEHLRKHLNNYGNTNTTATYEHSWEHIDTCRKIWTLRGTVIGKIKRNLDYSGHHRHTIVSVLSINVLAIKRVGTLGITSKPKQA